MSVFSLTLSDEVSSRSVKLYFDNKVDLAEGWGVGVNCFFVMLSELMLQRWDNTNNVF